MTLDNRLTEEEAKKLWCPAARVATTFGPANRIDHLSYTPDLGENTRCIASGCMKWEWVTTREDGANVGRCGL
jgi:hypothetical protein